MAVDFDDFLFIGSDNWIVLSWHKRQHFLHFQSSSRPVYAIALKHLLASTCAFLAHNKGEIIVRNISPRDAVFTPACILQKLCDSLKNMVPFGREPHDNAIACLCLSDYFNFI
jgi:hypothetical protein